MRLIPVDPETLIIDCREEGRTTPEQVADKAREHFKVPSVMDDLNKQMRESRGHGFMIYDDGIFKYQMKSIDPNIFLFSKGKELQPTQTRALVRKHLRVSHE